jgi:hypothetical protein
MVDPSSRQDFLFLPIAPSTLYHTYSSGAPASYTEVKVTMVVGPLDRRKRRKRCEGCAQRRVKVLFTYILEAIADSLQCEGEWPCKECAKRSLRCVAQEESPSSSLVLIHHKAKATPHGYRLVLPPNHPNSYDDRLAHHFFNDFMSNNNFGFDIDDNMIYSQTQCSSSLHAATNAVTAVSMARTTSNPKLRLFAVRSYQSSIIALRSNAQENKIIHENHTCWTTFFLGLFEVNVLY